jgi:WD40 repeat protein
MKIGYKNELVAHYFMLICFQSLTGHTTPVESVRFGPDEEMVMAGSMSGALKIWDLEQAKSNIPVKNMKRKGKFK